MCLRGASDLQDELFAKNADADLRGYVVWQPMLGGREEHVAEATRLVPDGRARHYWDGPGSTLKTFRETLGIGERSWDIYLVYGPDAKWVGDQPPEPRFWMHQLGSPSRPRVAAPYLDARAFAHQVAEALP